MYDHKRLILLASADARGGLTAVHDEVRSLDRLFMNLKNREVADCVPLPYTEPNQLWRALNEYGHHITIFHYSGHADAGRLVLEKAPATAGDSAHAGGLADLLGRQRGLKLFFLNGYSTLPQAELFLDAGVPAVINTSRAVKDSVARDFAIAFCEALTVGNEAVGARPGQTIAARDFGTVAPADVATGSPRGEPTPLEIRNTSVLVLSGDERTFATGGKDGAVQLWDPPTGKARTRRLAGYDIAPKLLGRSGVHAMAFSADGKTLATGDSRGKLPFWDVAKRVPVGQPIQAYDGWNGVCCLSCSLDGITLFTAGGSAGSLIKWDAATIEPLRERVPEHQTAFACVALSDDGRTLATGRDDGMLRLWDAGTGRVRGADRPLTPTSSA